MRFRKFLCGLIAASLLIGSTPTTLAASETPVETGVITFLDISGHWAASHIERAAVLGLDFGSTEYFRPDEIMTRAECITMLWQASGAPKPKKESSFTDLDQDWYQDAVAWAQESRMVKGIGNGLFNPYGAITREQVATLLHRMAGSPVGMETMFRGVYDYTFTDSERISSWAKSSLYWTIFNVIYCGVTSPEVGTELNPSDAASRAQIAVMVTRYFEEG